MTKTRMVDLCALLITVVVFIILYNIGNFENAVLSIPFALVPIMKVIFQFLHI